MVEFWSPKPTMGVRFPLLLHFLNIFISKNDKNLAFQSLKVFFEEFFGTILLIKNYQDLDNYNLSFFPEEVVIIYYDPSMENHNKYHHLIYNTPYTIIITEHSWSYVNSHPLILGFNSNFILWYSKIIIKFYKKKYFIDRYNINDGDIKIANQWIISKKYPPHEFYKTLLFIEDLSNTITYLDGIVKTIVHYNNHKYQTPFMNFYGLMMGSYNKPAQDYNKILSSIIIFNDL